MRLALRWKLFVSLVVPTVGIGVAIVLLTGHWLRELEVENFRQEQLLRTQTLANRIDDRLSELERIGAKTAAELTLGATVTEIELYDTLRRIVEHDAQLSAAGVVYQPFRFSPLVGEFHPFVVRTADGGVEDASAEHGRLLLSSSWYAGLVGNGEFAWLTSLPQDGHEGRVVRYGVPFGQDVSNPDGLVVLATPVDSLRKLAVPGIELDDALALIDEQGRVISTNSDLLPADATLDEIALQHARPGFAELSSELALAGARDIDGVRTPGPAWLLHASVAAAGWTLMRIVPVESVLAFPAAQLRRASFAMGLLAVLLTVSIFVVASRITSPVRRLSEAANRLGTGDFTVRAKETGTDDELGDLARTFNQMVGELELRVDELTRTTAAKEAVEGELRAARRIQTSLLPSDTPPFPGREEFEVFASNAPAAEVGGDFFDYFIAETGELVLIIGDVSGKGVPAALLMAVSRTIVRNLGSRGLPPEEILTETNRLLLQDNISGMCLTLFVALYDPSTGRCRYANGAHLPPLLVSADGDVSTVGEATGTLVGILEDAEYHGGEIELHAGDLLVLYTDGLTEARAADGGFFGDEPVRRLLKAYSDAPSHFLCERIEREVNTFQGGERSDDLTLLLLRRRH